MTAPLNRALPGPVIDLIREGVRADDLAARGGRAVWSALVKTAMSACQRGWDCWEWKAVILEPASHLGQQVRLKDGARPRTAKAVRETFDNAWETATVRVSESPARGRHEALGTAAAVRDFVADPDSPLTDAQRAVLAAAAAVGLRVGTDRVALPRRDLLAATGLGLTALRTLLRALHDIGLLVQVDPGRAGGPAAKKRRAALYRLPSPDVLHLYRETRSVVPLAQVCGAPISTPSGAPLQVCGAPPLSGRETDQSAHQIDRSAGLPSTTTHPEEGPAVVTFTLTAPTGAALAEALAAIQRSGVQADRADQQPAEPEAPRLRVVGAGGVQ
ncbi:MAG: hypothetical protein ACR2J4_00440 [Deinococcus sp.]